MKRPGCTNGAISKDRLFTISVKLIPTGETFLLKKVHNDMKISELKHLAEYSTGIPQHIQRLCYLDEGDLQEHTDVRHNDIVPGAVLHMSVWQVWKSLVEAAATNDTDYLFRLGVTQDTDFKTPNSQYMGRDSKKDWIAERAFTALYIAAHRGYVKTARRLIDAGADVNGRTGLGQTPLHVAAANGHGTVVDLLLEKGADIDEVDQFGESALAVAMRFGHKGCERHLFLFRWQQRAKQIKPAIEHELFAHQYFDSKLPVWFKGKHAQMYFTKILPPGEFEGTGLDAPRRKVADEQGDSQDHGDSDANTQSSTEGAPRVGGMSPIREETSSAGDSIDGVHFHDRGKHTTADGKKQTYDEWLEKKQLAEQQVINQRKKEEAIQKLAEEDKKRQEEFADKSYEQWLAEKEVPPKPSVRRVTVAKTAGAGVPGGSTANAADARLVSSNDVNTAAIATKKRSKTPQTTTDVIKAIMKRQAEEGETPTVQLGYQERDDALMEQIRLGRTPLQKRLHQMVL